MKKNKKYLVLFVLVMLVSYLVAFIRDSYRERMLLKSNITFGVISEFAIGGRGPGKMVVRFKVGNETKSATYNSSLIECNPKIGVSDTVLIKYSLNDNTIIKLLKCYWNADLRNKYLVKH
jgi:hypothetical protein